MGMPWPLGRVHTLSRCAGRDPWLFHVSHSFSDGDAVAPSFGIFGSFESFDFALGAARLLTRELGGGGLGLGSWRAAQLHSLLAECGRECPSPLRELDHILLRARTLAGCLRVVLEQLVPDLLGVVPVDTVSIHIAFHIAFLQAPAPCLLGEA